MPNPDRMGFLQRKHTFLHYRGGDNSFVGFIGAAGAGVSVGTGDAPEAEADTAAVVGLHMDAGDMHDWWWIVPFDLNPLHPIGFRVIYSSDSATAADDRTWILLYDAIAEDAALAIGSTALTTAIAAETDNGTAGAWQQSARGILAGQTLTETQVAAPVIMALDLELDVDDASEEMQMYGLLIDYVPKNYQGAPHNYNPAYNAR